MLFFFSNSSVRCLRPSLKMVLNVSVTVSPFLSFNGTIQPYLENRSKTMRRYLQPLFHLLNCCISTRSEHQILPIPFVITRRQVKLRFMGLCNSSANCGCQFIFSPNSSRALANLTPLVSSPVFPRKKWIPFINRHNGRVNDVIYCDNLGKKWVPPY